MPPYSLKYKSYRRRLNYHGNYCGPGWSGGEFRNSVCGGPEPRDAFDASCRKHDCSYARGDDLSEADFEFFQTNIGGGVQSGIAAIGVGTQGVVRRAIRSLRNNMQFPPTPQKDSNMDNMSVSSASHPSLLDFGNNVRHTSTSDEGYFVGKKINDSEDYRMISAPGGCKYRKEIRFNCIGGEIAWFGHHNFPYIETLGMMARACTKHLLYKAGYLITDWVELLYGYLTGATITYFYSIDPEIGIENSVSYTIVGTDGGNDLVNQVGNLFTSIAAIYADHIPHRLWLTKVVRDSAGTGQTTILLSGMMLDGLTFHLKSYSSMNIQNSTLSNLIDNADLTTNVDAVTLQGRMYKIKGNYAQKRGYNVIPFDLVADPTNGILRPPPTTPTGANAFSEPVESYQFFGCNRSMAIQMPPGSIKTSAFGDYKEIKLRSMLKNYNQKVASTGTNPHGHMHLLCLEKKVQIVSTLNAILLNCNLNWELTVCLSIKDNKISKNVVARIDLPSV